MLTFRKHLLIYKSVTKVSDKEISQKRKNEGTNERKETANIKWLQDSEKLKFTC
jgi:hypothetical protein